MSHYEEEVHQRWARSMAEHRIEPLTFADVQVIAEQAARAEKSEALVKELEQQNKDLLAAKEHLYKLGITQQEAELIHLQDRDAHKHENRELKALVKELVEALRKLEWVLLRSANEMPMLGCPMCGRCKFEGHNAVCSTALAIARAETKGEPESGRK